MNESGIKGGIPQWKDQRGWLSAGSFGTDEEMVLQDGTFYQDFAYQIRSSISINRFESIVKDLIHPSGMAMFAQVIPPLDLSSYHFRVSNYTDLIFDVNTVTRITSGRPFDELFRTGDVLEIVNTAFNDGQNIIGIVTATTMTFTGGHGVVAENATDDIIQLGAGIGVIDVSKESDGVVLEFDPMEMSFDLGAMDDQIIPWVLQETMLGFGFTWQDAERTREVELVEVDEWINLIVSDFNDRATERFLFVPEWEIDIDIPDEFKIVVEPWRDASTTNYYLGFPVNDTVGDPLIYDFTIDWGDGTQSHLTEVDTSAQVGPQNHIYDAVEGERFTISVTGICPGLKMYGGHSALLKEVSQWGTQSWTQLNGAFSGHDQFTITATDTPDFSQCTDIEWMFSQCDSLVDGIQNFNFTGTLTSIANMFYDCNSLNPDISGWVLGNVTDCTAVFKECELFNGNVSGIDVSNVTTFYEMFWDCQALGSANGFDTWDVSAGTDFYMMFGYCYAFNNDVSGWTINTLAPVNMQAMFFLCRNFNQPIGAWDTSSVNNMDSMFYTCEVFNQDLNTWDVSSVLDMDFMFDGCLVFNGNVTPWITTGLSHTIAMFRNCYAFNQPIGGWDMSAVSNVENMFQNCYAFNQPLDAWDISGFRIFNLLFAGCTSFNQDLNSWQWYAGITEHRQIFDGASSFNGNISSWDVSEWTWPIAMFRGCSNFNGDLSGWDVSSITSFNQFFFDCTSFNSSLVGWVTTNATKMDDMFTGCTIFNQSVNHFDMNGVTNIDNMFEGCAAFDQPLNLWDVSTCNYMGYVFKDSGFNQDISIWNVNAVQTFTSMFENCPFNQDISGWIINSNALFFASMFKNNTVFNQDISGWDVSAGAWDVAQYTDMFLGATAFSTANYDLLLNAWALLSMPTGEDCAFESQYTIATSQAARDTMTITRGWTITDGGGI